MSRLWNSAELRLWCEALQNGNICIAPAEGAYGYCVDASNEGALRKLVALQGLRESQGFITLISSFSQLSGLAAKVTETDRETIYASWPGPITLLFEGRKELPAVLTGELSMGKRESVAVRLPNSAYMREYLTLCGKIIVSATVYGKGRTPITDAAHLPHGFATLKLEEPLSGKLSKIYDPENGRWLR